jgi:putative addiction module component (TIGR02574 family)
MDSSLPHHPQRLEPFTAQLTLGILRYHVVMSVQDIEQAALNLSLEERARLAHRLLHSLDEPSSEENEKLWTQVAERRVQELRSGNVKGIPSEDVLSVVRVVL